MESERFESFRKRQSEEEINNSINVQNQQRPLSEFRKISVIKGDAVKTIPDFIKNNDHIVVALLHLDFDIYKPSKVALENFLPRMPKGSVIALDGTNAPDGPGEAIALLESIKINNVKIKRNIFDSFLCYLEI